MPDLGKLKRIKAGLEKQVSLKKEREALALEEKEEERQDEEATKLAMSMAMNEGLVVELQELKEIIKGQQMIIEAPKVNVNVPDVIVPEIKAPTVVVPKIASPTIPNIKIPKITVPKPEVTVNVPKFPKIPTPQVNVDIPDAFALKGITAKKPLHVLQVGPDGKVVTQTAGGGSNASSLNKLINKEPESFPLEMAKGNIEGHSFIHKFGATPDFDSGDGVVDIWDGANDGGIDEMQYTYSTTAAIDSVSTDEAGATQEVEVQGLDSDYGVVTQTVTLNGHQRVALSTPLIRTFRMKNVSVTDFAATVVAYENTAIVDGIPSDTTKIRAVVDNVNNQTLMALYTIPAGKTGYMRSFFAGSAGASKTTDYVIDLFARPFGQVFQLKHRSSLVETGTSHWNHVYSEPEVFKEKTDIVMRTSTTESPITAASVAAGFDIVLVDN